MKHLDILHDPSRTGDAVADARARLDTTSFRAAVAATAAQFAAAGIGRGDVVATVLTNRVELVVALYATWDLGAVLRRQPRPHARRDRLPAHRWWCPPGRRRSRHRRQGDRRLDRRRHAARAGRPEPATRSRGARRPGPAHLHERHDGPAQGRDARPRQHRVDDRHAARAGHLPARTTRRC